MDYLTSQINGINEKLIPIFSDQDIRELNSFKNSTLFHTGLMIISSVINDNLCRNNLLEKLKQSKNCFKKEAIIIGLDPYSNNFFHDYYRFISILTNVILKKIH